MTGSTDNGLLEGSLRGQIGLFPAACVQEIRMKSYENSRNNHLAPPANNRGKGGNKGAPSLPRMKKVYAKTFINLCQVMILLCLMSFALLSYSSIFRGTDVEQTFVCRWGEPHTVILHRGQKGFGFILRGAKADSPLMELQPSERFPALQYLDDVDENGVADRAGLRKGDFILAV